MSKSLSLMLGLALLLAMAQAADACTSIRIKTTDGLVFYARTMEGAIDYQSNEPWFPKGRFIMGPCRTIPPRGSPGASNMAWSA